MLINLISDGIYSRFYNENQQIMPVLTLNIEDIAINPCFKMFILI